MVRAFLCFLLLPLLACGQSGSKGEEVLFQHAMDSNEALIGASDLVPDDARSTDGVASLRIDAREPMRIALVEVPLQDLDDTVLQYRAKLRSQGLEGVAYLEMWCRVKGQGEFFSRALQDPLRGDRDWISQETPFFLRKGQRVDLARLNLVIDGHGTVWIDQLELLRGSDTAVGGR